MFDSAEVSAFRQFIGQKRFGSLDGLRAISIAAVIWHHTAPHDAIKALVDAGTHGVSLFFAISGFLITTLMLRERDRNGSVDLAAFYLRRSLRIFPLYYLTLCLYVLLVAAVERQSSVGVAFFNNLPYFATYTTNWYVELDGRVIFYFSWSLAAEEQFYLLWPALLTRCQSDFQAGLLLVCAIFACVVGQLLHERFLSAIPIPILAGALLAIVLNDKYGFDSLYRVFGRTWTQPLLVLLIGVSLGTQQPYGFLNSLLWAGLVASCVIREEHPLQGLLSLRYVAYVGSISYGMYLLHMLCKNFVVKLLQLMHMPSDGGHVFVLTLLAAIGVASLSYRYFETVFLNMRLRFAR